MLINLVPLYGVMNFVGATRASEGTKVPTAREIDCRSFGDGQTNKLISGCMKAIPPLPTTMMSGMLLRMRRI